MPLPALPAVSGLPPLLRLPQELQLNVLRHLPGPDLATVRRVCRRLDHMGRDNLLWRHAVASQQPQFPQPPPPVDYKDLFAKNHRLLRTLLAGTWNSIRLGDSGPRHVRGLLRIGPLTGVIDYDGVTAWQTDPFGPAARLTRREFGPRGCTAAAALDHEHVVVVTDRSLEIWHVQGHRLWSAPSRGSESGAVLALSPTQFAVAYHTGEIDVWAIEQNPHAPARSLLGHQDRVNSLALSEGGWLISGASDHTARLWDLQTGACLRTLADHGDYVRTVAALSNDRIATTSRDCCIRIWDAGSGALLQRLNNSPMMTYALCELPGGLLATGDVTGTLRVWHVETARCLRVVKFQGRPCNIREMICVGPTRILAITDGQGVLYYDVTPAKS